MANVLITGTSSGIGFATALAFGRAGHKVAATMREPAKAPALAKVAGDEHLAIAVISGPQGASHYPQQNRMAAFYSSVLKSPTLPFLVADRVLGIAVSGTWQLRHPVGPDAVPFLTWRKAMTDEEWVAWGSLDDDAWYARVKAEFGIDARPKAG